MSADLFVGSIILAVMIVFERLFPQRKNSGSDMAHALRNLSLALINALIALWFAGTIVAVSVWAQENRVGLLNQLEFPFALKTIFSFILIDGWMYVWHRASHRLRWLWSFHQVHHTDSRMDATTALRFHPLEIVLSNILELGVILAAGLHLPEIIFYRAILFIVIVVHHSNVRVSIGFDRLLQQVIVSPLMHRVHHSQQPRECHANYGSVFSFWDKIFRSLCRRADMETLLFGLPGQSNQLRDSLIDMLTLPVRSWVRSSS